MRCVEAFRKGLPECGIDTATATQRDFLRYLLTFTEEHGYPPSHREIAEHLGVTSLTAVRCRLMCLEKKGFVRTAPTLSRSIHVTEAGRAQLGLASKESVGTATLGAAITRERDLFFPIVYRAAVQPDRLVAALYAWRSTPARCA